VVLAGVNAGALALQSKERGRLLVFRPALMSLSTFASASAVRLVFGETHRLGLDLGELAMGVAMLSSVHFIVNCGVMSTLTALDWEDGSTPALKGRVAWTGLSYAGTSAMACLIIKLLTVVPFYALMISVPILAITYFTYKVYTERVETSNRHAEQVADLHLKTIEALAIAIDAKDEVTHDHVRRVQIYATGLARLFGLSEPEIEALKAGALLHDIGKLAVPDYILNKPGALTPAEFEKMKIHTIVGAEILERVGFPYPVVPVVRHHHERWDGRGYPDGLRGDEIPITARILTLADSFDAMREDRNYRKAMTREQAVGLLNEGSGIVFDPNFVRT